jgi:hypothetical protein
MTRRVLLAYAALALLTAFWPVLLGQLPVPTDCALRLLPGHSLPREGNDEIWDVPTAFLPWTRAVSDAYRHGRLPLHFAANGCGTPLWANPQAQSATPTTWITWFLPEAWALAVAAALRLWLAAAGVFLWLKKRKVSDPAAALGGLAYAFSLAFTAWLHYPIAYPQALLPWLALALERVAEGGAGGVTRATLVVAALALGGYPEGEFLAGGAGLCVFAAALVQAKRARVQRLASLVVAVSLGVGLTAVVWLPQVHAVLASERSARVERGSPPAAAPFSAELLRPPLYLDTLRYWVAPEARGNPRDGDKFGPYSFAGRASGYAGVLVLALALAAFAWRRAPAAVSVARIALLLLVVYVIGLPLLRWAVDAMPGLRFAIRRVTTSRMLFLAVFLLALLAAFQLDRLRKGSGRVATLATSGLLLLTTAVVFVQFLRDPAHTPLNAWRAVRFLLPALLLGGAVALLRLPLAPPRVRVLTLLVVLGTALDLLRIGARFNPGTLSSDYFPVTPLVGDLRSASEGARFASNSGALSGVAYMYGLADVGVQDPIAPARYVDALAAGTGYDAPAHPLGNVRRIDAPLLDFANARGRLDGATVRAVAAPYGVFPERLIGCTSEAELLARLATEPDLLRAALVVGKDEDFRGSAEILARARPFPERILLRLRSDVPRVLVLPESDDGGWIAETQGQPLPIFLANGAFLAIRVPAGESRILCRYLPPGFREGLTASAFSTILASVLLARRALRRGRPRAPSKRD